VFGGQWAQRDAADALSVVSIQGGSVRVLMIAPEPFFEPRGTPFSVYHRARALGRLGHEIDLVTYPIGQPVSLERVTIYRTWRPPFIRRVKIGPSLAKLPLDALLFLRACGLLLRRRYDCVHTHEEAGLFGAIFSALFRLPHIYDMHSDLAQQLVNFQFTRSRLLIGLMRAVERLIVRSARVVIVICPELQETVDALAPGKPAVLIENTAVAAEEAERGADEAALAGALARLRREMDLAEGAGPILVYTGTFEPYQGLDLVVRSMPQVLSAFPGAIYVLAGGRPDQVAALATLADGLGVRHALRLPGQRAPEEMPAFMQLADILISPRSEGTNTPLKIYSYLHAGKPLLATNIRSHTQVLTPDVAVLVDPTAEALAAGARALLGDAPLRGRLAHNARVLARDKYSYETFLARTSQTYDLVWPRVRPVAPVSAR
jgi:glycosyltransferase involved in cell wall biosynthesis